MIVFAGWPPLKRIIVGIDSTWKLACRLLILIDVQLDDAEILVLGCDLLEHRGNHIGTGRTTGAQKSTSTPGVCDSITSAWKLASVSFAPIACHGISLVLWIACLLSTLYKMK